MGASPFKYGSTVSAESFTNREDECTKLYNNLTQGIHTTIISPRRWGKSSLVEKVLIEIGKKEKRSPTVLLDMFSTASEEEFLELFAREVIKASSSKWQDWVNAGKTFFKFLNPKMHIGVNPAIDFTIQFDWDELRKHKDEVLNLPEVIAERKDLRFIICLDEFQNLALFSDYEVLEKKMRAAWQRHKKVTYCFFGSKRHMMTDIFNNSSKPFYRFGDIMILPKIGEDKWLKFIVTGFRKSGKKIAPQVAVQIPRLMKNHSWYVQQLAHYTWQKTAEEADLDVLQRALEELIHANMPLYEKEVETISATQINLLKAIVKGEPKLMATQTMQEYRLGTPRNVAKNRDSLLKNDTIHELDGKFELLDPAFELWFRWRYFNEPSFQLIP
jgi:hypothetical protein